MDLSSGQVVEGLDRRGLRAGYNDFVHTRVSGVSEINELQPGRRDGQVAGGDITKPLCKARKKPVATGRDYNHPYLQGLLLEPAIDVSLECSNGLISDPSLVGPIQKVECLAVRYEDPNEMPVDHPIEVSGPFLIPI